MITTDYGGRRALSGEVCRITNCLSPIHAKGLCPKHYQRNRKTGTTDRDPNWRAPNGTGHVCKDGYRRFNNPVGEQLEHRLVMEEHLGRELTRDENVHHINGQRADNRLVNLELWSTRQPKGQRVTDKLKWAKEIIELYDNI